MENKLFIQVYYINDYFKVKVNLRIFKAKFKSLGYFFFNLIIIAEFINFFKDIDFNIIICLI